MTPKTNKRRNGFYFDLDQVILKSFDTFTDYDVVWGGDKINYSGVIGMFKRCPLAKEMHERTRAKIEAGTTAYCEAGNWLWDEYIKTADTRHYRTLQTPQHWFYPVEQSYMMKQYYDGARPDISDSYALHWFGGHPDSQAFNQQTNEQIDKTLSVWLK
jgi:hypothetical protein